MAKGRKDGATIVLKRVEEGGHGHHGGAWKVAYADFVTAMMAFFLLMWLLNATSEEQRKGLADYFAPANVLGRQQTGSGQPFGGRTPSESAPMTQNAGAMRVENGPVPVLQDVEREDESETPARPLPWRDAPEGEAEGAADRQRAAPAPSPAGEAEAAAMRERAAQRETEALARAAEELRQAIAQDPALAELGRQLLIEQTPQGLRIQLVDAERRPMFALGGAAPNERARALLARVAQVAARMPNAIAITGHTDATPFRAVPGSPARSNWDLSAERANATRRLLTEAGLPEGRIRSITGAAEREPLLADAPGAAANRRVAITLLREERAP
jgi:chemotaxis protein MotB